MCFCSHKDVLYCLQCFLKYLMSVCSGYFIRWIDFKNTLSSKFNFGGYVKYGCEWQKVCWRPFVRKLGKQENADYSSLWDKSVDYQGRPPNFLDY
jgi:hypothetical protein